MGIKAQPSTDDLYYFGDDSNLLYPDRGEIDGDGNIVSLYSQKVAAICEYEPIDGIIEKEISSILWEKVDSLESKSSDVLKLRFGYEGNPLPGRNSNPTLDDIKNILGISTVEHYLNHGLNTLGTGAIVRRKKKIWPNERAKIEVGYRRITEANFHEYLRILEKRKRI